MSNLSSEQLDLWTTGLLEVAGSMYFDPKGRPAIEIRDNDLIRVEKLQQLLGGRIYKNGTTWHVSDLEAIEVAKRIENHSHIRRLIVKAFLGWQTVSEKSRAQKNQYVQDTLEGQDRKNVAWAPVLESDYRVNVLNPLFMGGVIDGRGMLLLRKSLQKIIPELQISTRNLPLLEAFSGSTNKAKVDISNHGYGTTITHHLRDSSLKRFFTQVNPVILLREYQHILDFYS